MTMLHYITVFGILVTIVAGSRTNTKQVRAVCFRNDITQALEMYLSAMFTPGEVDKVIAVDGTTFLRQPNGTTNEVSCTIDGALSSGQILIRADVVIGGASTSQNQCGARLHQTSTEEQRDMFRSLQWRRLDLRRIEFIFSLLDEMTNDLVVIPVDNNLGQYMWTFQFREKFADGAITDLDRSYTIVCNYNSATPNSVVTNVFVIALDTLSNATRIRPENELAVLERTSSPSNNNLQVTDTIVVGQTVKLRVQSKVKVPGRRIVDYDHYGTYVFSCDYRTSFGGQGTPIVGSNGCPIASNPFGLTQGFQYTRFKTQSGYRWFQTETNEFVMASTLPGNNFYFLRCYVGYCYTVDNGDPRCRDFCASNSNRKKRSLQTDEDQIVLTIKINPPEAPDAPDQDDQPGTSGMRSAIIISASIIGVMVMVAMIFVLVICCLKYRRRHDPHYHVWDTSSSSSQSLPRHLTHDHIRAFKSKDAI